jgi:hypothetical protein
MNQRPCVNGVLAAVLSASFLPIHGALAKEERPANPSGARKFPAKNPPASKHGDKLSPDGAAGTGDKR